MRPKNPQCEGIKERKKIKKYYDDSLDITFTFEYYIRGNKDIRTRTVRFIPDGKGNYAPGNGL